ncbi:MAG: uracil-DNA glycosylase family protein [Thermomicrobiales bacterium]
MNDGPPNLAYFTPRIAALPAGAQLTKAELLTPVFLLHESGRLAVYYAPFDYVNPAAKVVLVGIAPGFRQMEIALRGARDLLWAGAELTDVAEQVKYLASFAGPIRRFLVQMLDGIGLARALAITTCADLYGARHDLLHTTAAVRHPVFVGGKDWTGHTPPVRRNPLLLRYVREGMRAELDAVPGALVLTLGRCAEDAVQLLLDEGALDPARCLIGLPHPSGANGRRYVQYAQVRDELTRRVAAWFSDRALVAG